MIRNGWSIGRGPAVFRGPETLDPQRWLDADGNVCGDMCAFVFGFGRRVCSRRHMATVTIVPGV
ncbi:hypothetical protein BD779DRAFT_1565802 [Infundibulicybe gibba]|nr:hypothetical protein BD779DRAFT_1565802 [Infundibulicybe gibba]